MTTMSSQRQRNVATVRAFESSTRGGGRGSDRDAVYEGCDAGGGAPAADPVTKFWAENAVVEMHQHWIRPNKVRGRCLCGCSGLQTETCVTGVDRGSICRCL